MPTACETYAAFYFSSVATSATAVKSKAAQHRVLLETAPRYHWYGTQAPWASFTGGSADAAATITEARVADQTTLTAADRLVEWLIKLEGLGPDWDGNGAAEPQAASVKAAREFVRTLSPESVMPKATLLADGNAVLYVTGTDLYAEIEFDGGPNFSYYIRRGAEECFDEAKLSAQGLPYSLTGIGLASDAIQIADAA